MTRQEVESVFTIAGLKPIKMWEMMNQYWPRSKEYYQYFFDSPWWLVKTEIGLIEIGCRKRVINIDWEDTSIRRIVTSDETTKGDTFVHAWSLIKAAEYLGALKDLKCST